MTLQAYHKSTYTGLLLNFKSFASFSYKMSLIKCSIDKLFNIYNNWNPFHNEIESIESNLTENAYPPFLTDKVIKKYLNHKFSSEQNTSNVHYLNCCISPSCHTKLKINFRNFAKSFVKKMLTLS